MNVRTSKEPQIEGEGQVRMIANKEEGVAVHAVSEHFLHGPSSRLAPVDTDELNAALERTRGWLLSRQREDGHWVGELEGDTILESEYILLYTFLGREREPICGQCARYMLDQQLPGGGWAIYPGGPVEISASVKAYFALKILGYSPDDPALVKARHAILEVGGVHACNSFTRFYLAMLGQIPYDDCPTVPPELVLLPYRLPFSLAAMSSWTRTIVIPLAIISHFKPVRTLEPEKGIGELFVPGKHGRRTSPDGFFSWSRFFLGVDRVFKWCDRWLPTAWRRPGVRAAERWMLEHFENSDGLGAIFPPMIYTVLALRCLGYEDSSPYVQWAWRHLNDLMITEGDRTRLQPCVSPVWDTAIATIAISDADQPDDDPAITLAADWLQKREIRHKGDWQVRRPGVVPSGWSFEYQNEFYPDIDDSAMVLMAILRSPEAASPEIQDVVQRGVNWLLAMQNRDGGWAAFDADIDNQVLTKVPFADHNAMLDPSCADITARVVEMLGVLGYRADHPAITRALDYLWRTQEPEGCWYGRWGVNYLYGTWQVLQGLKAIDFPMDHPQLIKAADWVESVQQSCGGWGETCESYDDPALKGIGTPTASQTAWAALALTAAGRARGEAVRRGITFLLESQAADGSWEEVPYTGTGFPKVFYLKYHLYRVYFPLMAIARYRRALLWSREHDSPARARLTSAQSSPLDGSSRNGR